MLAPIHLRRRREILKNFPGIFFIKNNLPQTPSLFGVSTLSLTNPQMADRFAFATEILERERVRLRCRAQKIVLCYGHTPHDCVDACISAISTTGYGHILVGKDHHADGSERLRFACFADAPICVVSYDTWNITVNNKTYSPQKYRIWSALDAVRYITSNGLWELYTWSPAWRLALARVAAGTIGTQIPATWKPDTTIWRGKGHQLFNGEEIQCVVLHDGIGTQSWPVSKLTLPIPDNKSI